MHRIPPRCGLQVHSDLSNGYRIPEQNNGGLVPISRTSRNFSGDLNPFVSSKRTRFKLRNKAVILKLISETY